MSNKKYDHDKRNILEACGFSKQRVDEMQARIDEIQNGDFDRVSQLIEKFGNEFNSHEMAFIHVVASKKRTVEMSFDKIGEVMSSIRKRLQDEEETTSKNEKSIPFFMGGGGDA